jgi:PKD repeat protein
MLRRLTLAAVTLLACGALAPRAADAATTDIGDGAWSWFGDPRAVTHEGRTYVGWVDHEGDIKVSSFDHATGERVTAVLAARLNRDDHANPSIQVRPDGRLAVFYSRHVGPAMHYRVSSNPKDVRSWEPPRTLAVNVPGIRGYTYPNPVRLAAEGRTYLFWRGGNYNPAFSTQDDGSSSWSPARNLMLKPNERPYAKYAESGGDTIHVAYTNAHPNEFPSVNVYYARISAGRIEQASGQQIGTLAGPPIAPEAGDVIFDGAEPSWVHDVAADSSGNPVIVFASFPSPNDHRYHYARWNDGAWDVHEITPAGGSFREELRPADYYSGGLTLDHEDPSRVYLSRQTGASWQVEAWSTADGGASWTAQGVSVPSAEKNVRPVSPRGMTPFGGDLGVVWMRGAYPNYVDYRTSIAALTAGAPNLPPVADAEPAVRSGPAPLEVRFDGSPSRDPDGAIASWQWDFGDGSGASGAEVTHTYAAAGRYFPSVTVTDAAGSASTLVEEITVGLPAVPVVHSGGAGASSVHGAIDPENRATQWQVEYGPTEEYGAVTAAGGLPGDDALHQVEAALPGLVPGRLYHYRFVATNASGSSEGRDRLMIAGRTPGSDAYREALLGTPGLAAYWRLGELSGRSAANAVGGAPGSYAGRFVLGQPGVLGPVGDTAASFDGASSELAAPGPALSGDGATIEGWFNWRAGTSVMRDSTSAGGTGWLPAFDSGGFLRYRLGGNGFDTGLPVDLLRDGVWHHVAAVKDGGAARLYVDGALVHQAASGAGSDPAAGAWHVMRNGTGAVFSEGEADEVALYTRALGAAEIKAHYDLARTVAAAPLPAEPPLPAAEPPAAGTGRAGAVLGRAAPRARPRAGLASVRRGRLVVFGAPRRANRIVARKMGTAWRVTDAAAPLRAGRGCRRLSGRAVSCRAAQVRSIALHGGDGADRLTVIGPIRALLVGGRGRDRLAGGPLATFRGGPGADRVLRRRR